jgi:SSS family solute:Na+ symporter
LTHFGWIDGSIVGLYLLATMAAGLMVRRYVRGVDDFLVAGREMDVNLGIASLAATEFKVVTCMYAAENRYRYGFAGATPGILMALAMFVVGSTGFCVKPLREARVVTLPQLFELRFGPGVRRAAGVVIVLGGLLNMGVFLRTGGEFLLTVVGLGGLPGGTGHAAVGFAGWAQAHTLELTMTALLLLVAVYTVLGGMLSVLVTDFLQFIVMSLGLVVVTILILVRIGWSRWPDRVRPARPAASTPVNRSSAWAMLFQAFHNLAAVLTWQTTIQRVLAAGILPRDRRSTPAPPSSSCFLVPGLGSPPPHAGSGAASPASSPCPLARDLPARGSHGPARRGHARGGHVHRLAMLTWSSVIYNDIIAPALAGWTERRACLANRSGRGHRRVPAFYGLWYP